MHKIGVISDTHNVLREPVYAVHGNADIHTNMKRFVKTDRHGSTPAAAAGGVFCSLQQWQY